MELAPIAEPVSAKQRLLTEIANEAHIDDWTTLRWFAVGNPPRSIVVKKRGKNGETVCTISKTHNADAWVSWEPVLSEWARERQATGKRVSHAKLTKGRIK